MSILKRKFTALWKSLYSAAIYGFMDLATHKTASAEMSNK